MSIPVERCCACTPKNRCVECYCVRTQLKCTNCRPIQAKRCQNELEVDVPPLPPQSVTVKVGLYRSWRGGPIEFRLFVWEPSDAAGAGFSGFAKKVASVFPKTSVDQLKLHYADRDGDHIVISSDAELKLGLQQADGNVLRIQALMTPYQVFQSGMGFDDEEDAADHDQ